MREPDFWEDLCAACVARSIPRLRTFQMLFDTPRATADVFIPRIASDPLAFIALPDGGPDDSPEAQRRALREAVPATAPARPAVQPPAPRWRAPSSVSLEAFEPDRSSTAAHLAAPQLTPAPALPVAAEGPATPSGATPVPAPSLLRVAALDATPAAPSPPAPPSLTMAATRAPVAAQAPLAHAPAEQTPAVHALAAPVVAAVPAASASPSPTLRAHRPAVPRHPGLSQPGGPPPRPAAPPSRREGDSVAPPGFL